jgi:DNA-binding NarL/FixJ family response regulator
MPGNHGLTGLAAIRCRFPAVAVVVVSANEDPRVIRRVLDHGAAGFIPKSASPELLTEALRTILDCREWVPPLPGAQVAGIDSDDVELRTGRSYRQPDAPAVSRSANWSPMDASTSRSPIELDIQERTVKAHMSEILKKLDVRNRTQAGIAFRQLELVDPASGSRSEHDPSSIEAIRDASSK